MSLEDLKAWSGRRVLVLTPTPTHPVDFGNRKRVHEICRRLKELGSEVHLLHYASEADWRRGFPVEQQRQMAVAWDSFSTVYPTRPIHPPPQDGSDHEMDEWWDPAIGDALTWLFSRYAFEAFIVNYTWLSKALQFAPRQVLRILDTHDRFSGRREMLQAHGIAPEFFHVTMNSERAALERADVVWAIKEHEAEYFRQLTSRQVVVMPHADRPRTLRRAVRPAGHLVLGIVGAQNSINHTNILRFAKIAAPIFRRLLAPLTVRIAGSVCRLLPRDLGPHFELVGPVDDLTSFYEEIDAAIVPMSFSTGLKIKVSEALALGIPVVSHAHAFEGFEPHHATQVLPDFLRIAQTCVDLAYDPHLLVGMAAAARRSQVSLEAAVSSGIAQTGAALAIFRPRLLILASARSIGSEDSLQSLWLASCLPFLSAAAHVTLLVCDGDPATDGGFAERFRPCGVAVLSYPSSLATAGDRYDDLLRIVDTARAAAVTFVIDDALTHMSALPLSKMHLCVVLDVWGFGAPRDASNLFAAATGSGRVTVLGSDRLSEEHMRLIAACSAASVPCDYGLVPLFSSRYFETLDGVCRASRAVGTIVILSPYAWSNTRANALEQLLQYVDPQMRTVIVRHHPADDAEIDPQGLLREWLSGLRVDLVVDLWPGAPSTAALREIARRAGARFVDRLSGSSIERFTQETGYGGIVERLLHALTTATNEMDAPGHQTEYDNEAGWAWLWRYISEGVAAA